MDISLCLLTWNEIHGCRQVVPGLPLHEFSEVFALDGGSTDGTLEFLRRAGITVVPQRNRSYNAAYIEAIRHYAGEAIVFYHPKGTIEVASLPLITKQLRDGVDFVVASRMLAESTNEEDHKVIKHRKWFGLVLAHAASIRWRNQKVTRITDPLHGYRGLSRGFTQSLSLLPTGVTADLEMVRHAYISGALVSEVPVDETKREEGVTHFPAFSTGRQLLRYLIATGRHG